MLGDWLLWLLTLGWDRPNGREVERNCLEGHPPIFLFSLFRVCLCVAPEGEQHSTPGWILPLPDTLFPPSHPVCLSTSRGMEKISFAFCLRGGGPVCAMTEREGWEAPCALRSPAGLCAACPASAWVEFSRSIPLCHHHRFANSKKRNSWKCILSTQLTWSTSGFQRECCERFEIAALWKKWLGVIIDT